MTRCALFVALAWISAWTCAAAQQKAPPRSVRILAVGDTPPFRQEVVDGVRIQLPPPPGSIPPQQVVVGVFKDEQRIKAAGQAGLQLGRPTPPIKVASGEGWLVLAKDGLDGQPWVKLRRPEKGDFLVVLWRDETVGTWDKARALVMAPPAEAGKVTFINVAPGPVAMLYGGERIGLAPGKPLVLPLPAGPAVPCQFGLRAAAGGLERAIAQRLEQGESERTLVVLSKADGESPRRPMKVTVIREKVEP